MIGSFRSTLVYSLLAECDQLLLHLRAKNPYLTLLNRFCHKCISTIKNSIEFITFYLTKEFWWNKNSVFHCETIFPLNLNYLSLRPYSWHLYPATDPNDLKPFLKSSSIRIDLKSSATDPNSKDRSTWKFNLSLPARFVWFKYSSLRRNCITKIFRVKFNYALAPVPDQATTNHSFFSCPLLAPEHRRLSGVLQKDLFSFPSSLELTHGLLSSGNDT